MSQTVYVIKRNNAWQYSSDDSNYRPFGTSSPNLTITVANGVRSTTLNFTEGSGSDCTVEFENDSVFVENITLSGVTTRVGAQCSGATGGYTMGFILVKQSGVASFVA